MPQFWPGLEPGEPGDFEYTSDELLEMEEMYSPSDTRDTEQRSYQAGERHGHTGSPNPWGLFETEMNLKAYRYGYAQGLQKWTEEQAAKQHS